MPESAHPVCSQFWPVMGVKLLRWQERTTGRSTVTGARPAITAAKCRPSNADLRGLGRDAGRLALAGADDVSAEVQGVASQRLDRHLEHLGGHRSLDSVRTSRRTGRSRCQRRYRFMALS